MSLEKIGDKVRETKAVVIDHTIEDLKQKKAMLEAQLAEINNLLTIK
jgi:hypothetical protein